MTNTASQRPLYLALLGLGIFPFLVNGYVNSIIVRWQAAYWAFELLCWVGIPALVIVLAATRGGMRPADIGLNANLFGRPNLLLLGLLCVAFGPVELFIYKGAYTLLREAFPAPALFSYESVVPQAAWLRVLVAAYFALSAGIVEEIYFRGLFHKLAGTFPRPATTYLVASPLCFALVHWEDGPANLAATYLIGLLCALAYLGLRNLWPLIFGHVYTDYVWFS